jgi:hypothetical protein
MGGGIRLMVDGEGIGTLSTKALLRIEETSVEIMRSYRVVGVTPFNVFNKGIKVLTKTLKKVPNELVVAERLANGGQGVRQFFGLVVVNRH